MSSTKRNTRNQESPKRPTNDVTQCRTTELIRRGRMWRLQGEGWGGEVSRILSKSVTTQCPRK